MDGFDAFQRPDVQYNPEVETMSARDALRSCRLCEESGSLHIKTIDAYGSSIGIWGAAKYVVYYGKLVSDIYVS